MEVDNAKPNGNVMIVDGTLRSGSGYQSVDTKSRNSKEIPRWDIFKKPVKREQKRSDETRLVTIPLKIMRLMCYVFCFAITLGSSIMSKITLSLMTSQTKTNRTMDLCVEGTNKRYIVDTPIYERMGWNWAIFFVLIVPEFFVFVTCAWVCTFKNSAKPRSNAFLMVLLSETLHVIGVCLLVFVLAPSMDAISSVMFLNSLCLVPACLTLLSRSTSDVVFQVKVAFDIGSILVIVGGVILWAQAERNWLLPFVGILISCAWWENFIDEESNSEIFVYFSKLRKDLKEYNTRYFTYMLISVWKVALIFFIFLIYLGTTSNHDLLDLLSNFVEAFHQHKVILIQTWQNSESSLTGIRGEDLFSSKYLPLYLLLIQIGCSLFCFLTSVFSCQICIQEFSFSLPLCLSVPITVFLTSSACSWRMENFCFMTNIFPEYVYWKCPDGEFLIDFFGYNYGWVWILWFLAQAWVTSHIWNPLNIRRAAIDRLFVIPLYNGAIVEQSLLLNRRKHRKIRTYQNPEDMVEDNNGYPPAAFSDIYENLDLLKPKSDIKIYACATMWHETPDEMMEMLKSIMRVDKHLSDQREKRKYWQGDPTADYEFEVHVFFDDAYQWEKETVTVDGKEVQKKYKLVNDWVKKLISLMVQAAAKIYPENIRELSPPSLTLTPYGGRLQWNLPGSTPVIVHVKDKDRIRHKKRWSQVMYMYYLLGYITMDPKNDHRRPEIEENTFILALDGDIDFKPGAVTRLLDLMDDKSLGAACGRIHPIGAGPIVWYQKFEYAIGHWLQKAAEHVTGCVLCSPGCFSLFRAKAIMEVMRTYATVADQAIEYLQYDQGEDRWLCTLILKEGYRIEYSAASDAYTHAPESFAEFYIQRRRWGPSTMANIMDLLLDYKETIRKNNSISTPYIMYQCMIMLGTILGPGTIFLMVVGAMVSAFQISNYYALMYNAIPIGIFILFCFYAENDLQISFAMILSAAYALLMMAVLIATAIQLQEEGISSPSGIFLVAIASSFLISAIAHPQEFTCVCHGFLYFMLVPSMYLLLQIYSLINMYNVSWGTRENPAQKAEEAALMKAAEEEKKGKLDGVSEFLGLKDKESTLAKLCQCFMCTYDKTDDVKEAETLIKSNNKYLEDIDKRMIIVERSTEAICELMGRQNSPALSNRRFFPSNNEALSIIKETNNEEGIYEGADDVVLREKSADADKDKAPRPKTEILDDENHPRWAEDPVFKDSPRLTLPAKELTFWENMIKKYLKPLDRNIKTEQKVKGELIELRNKVVFAIFMMNAIFILIVFLLQLNKEQLFIEWPINAKYNVTYLADSNRVKIDYEYLKMDPIGLVFVVFFGTILVFQFLAMLVHRFGTFSHIMADTTLNCKSDLVQEFDGLSIHSDEEEDEEDEGDTNLNPRLSTVPPAVPGTPRPPRRKSRLWNNHMALPIHPADRHVSALLLNEDSTKKFETLEEAARNKMRKDILLLKRQSSVDSRRISLLRRASQNQSIKRLWRKEGVITDSDLENNAMGSHQQINTKSPTLSTKSNHHKPSPLSFSNSAFTGDEFV